LGNAKKIKKVVDSTGSGDAKIESHNSNKIVISTKSKEESSLFLSDCVNPGFYFFFQNFNSSIVIFFFAKTKRKRISNIPAVFTISKTINQFLCLRLADFQRESPFQTTDHR